MLNQFSVIITLFISSLALAQKGSRIALTDLCPPSTSVYGTKVNDVNKFRDTLILKLNLSTVTNGRKKDKEQFLYSEKFKNESSIIQISKKVALSITIARATDKGKKFYLYSLHLYRKKDNCWYDVYPNNGWSKCGIGHIIYGYSIGSKGTKEYIAFTGTISLY